MDPQHWFGEQLRTGRDAFIWSAKQIPEERRNVAPSNPMKLGEWTALRHVYHMWNYEYHIALPAMRLWLGGPPHSQELIDAFLNEDVDWEKHSYDKALEMFQQVRDEQIALLPQFSESAWGETCKIDFWGGVTLHWVVSKTFQHTMEHGSTVMQLALFWDRQ